MTNKKCPPVSCPVVDFCLSDFFGNPQGTHGRSGAEIQGIVLHCLGETQNQYDQRQQSERKLGNGETHASLHYTVGEQGIKQYVYLDDIAWGLDQYQSNFPIPLTPPYSYEGWPDLPSDYPLDYQVIHIGLAFPELISVDGKKAKCNCAETPYGLQMDQYRRLVHLLAYLAEQLCIPIDRSSINFHEMIENLGMCPDESCPCNTDDRLWCDVLDYCEVCNEDSTYSEANDLTWFYGLNEFGCKVKLNTKRFIDALCDLIMKKVVCAIDEATPIILEAAKREAQACIDALPQLTVTEGDEFSFDPNTLTLVLHRPLTAAQGDEFSFDFFNQDLIIPFPTELPAALSVTEGQQFSFDPATNTLVVQRGKMRFEGATFPADAIDGDILVTDANTPCEKRWIKCGDTMEFLSAARSEAAAVGFTPTNLPAGSTLQFPPFDLIPYDTHEDQGGAGLVDVGSNVIQAIECCSHLITAGMLLNDVEIGETYEIKLFRVPPGGGTPVLITADTAIVTTGTSVTLDVSAIQSAQPGVTYYLEIDNPNGSNATQSIWYTDITSQICEPENLV